MVHIAKLTSRKTVTCWTKWSMIDGYFEDIFQRPKELKFYSQTQVLQPMGTLMEAHE